MSVAALSGILGLAILQGALVALPRDGALAALARVRSPMWAALLPGAIVVGTFAPLWHRSLAMTLVVAAATTTPLLAALALLGVVRGRRTVAAGIAAALAGTAAVAPGAAAELALTAVTALASLSLGVALTRLIPRRWLLVGVVVMAGFDVLFLGAGVGRSADVAMATASAGFHGPHFTQATLGGAAIDYPDLVVASVLGGAVAGSGLQHRVAIAVALLAAATGMLLIAVPMVPETVPIALTFGLLATWRRAPVTRPGRSAARAAAARAALRVHVELPVCRHLAPHPCPYGCA